MAQFKHKQTNEIIDVPRIRIHFNQDGTTTTTDLSGSYDLSLYDKYVEESESSTVESFGNVKVTKSYKDGSGIR